MESLGKYLKTERELRNLSIQEAAKSTKVREQFLEAIEEERYELLPPGLYLKGFLAAYARYLGLDPNDVIQRYQKYLEDLRISKQKPLELKPQIRSHGKRVRPWFLFALFFTILLFIVFSVWDLPYKLSERRPPAIDREKSAQSPLQIEEKMRTETTEKVMRGEVTKEVPSFEVIKAGIGTGVEHENDQLVLKGKSSEFTCNNQKIYFFTRIKTTREEKIAHVWLWEGKEFQTVEMEVKPPEYSVYSYLTLRVHQSGNWKAEVKIGDTVLDGLSFKATKPYSVEE